MVYTVVLRIIIKGFNINSFDRSLYAFLLSFSNLSLIHRASLSSIEVLPLPSLPRTGSSGRVKKDLELLRPPGDHRVPGVGLGSGSREMEVGDGVP